jgi:leucyl/phenylalanyl-tRNA---protein transferase
VRKSPSLRWPIEPPATAWVFPDPRETSDDLVAIGADLRPGTVLSAYRQGLFPMPLERWGLGWWCPSSRGVLELSGFKVSRSLRRSARRFTVTVDAAFADVLEGCADPRRPGGWIDDAMKAAYLTLHELGWVHSVEVWLNGSLAGGVYGVALGGLFAGESMFHRERDASKVALLHLVELLDDGGRRLIDVQWSTPHLRSLGVKEIPRERYLARMPALLSTPLPEVFFSGCGDDPYRRPQSRGGESVRAH